MIQPVLWVLLASGPQTAPHVPDQSDSYYHFMLAAKAQADGSTSTALDEYQKAMVGDASDRESRLARTRVFLARMDLDNTKKEIDQILAQNPDDPEANQYLGTYYYAQKDREGFLGKAREALEKAAKGTSDPGVFARLGEIYIEEDSETPESLRKALGAWDRYANLQPDDPEGHFRKGLLSEALKDDAAAEAGFLRAVEIAPDYAPAFRALIGLYARQGRGREMRELCSRVLDEDPGNPHTRAALAATLYEQGLFSQARDVLDYEARAASYGPAASGLAARIYAQLDRPRRVIEILKDTTTAKDPPPDLSFELAQAYEQIGDYQTAAGLLQVLTPRTDISDKAEIFFHLGYCQQQLKLDHEAEKSFAAGIAAAQQANEKHLEMTLRRFLTILLSKRGEQERAQSMAADAAKLFPDALEIRTLPADLLWESGKKKDAIQLMQKLLRAEKQPWGLRVLLARRMISERKPKDLISLLATPIRQSDAPQEAFRLLATAYEQSGKLDASLATYRQALARWPDSPGLKNDYGYTLIIHGREIQKGVDLVRDAVLTVPEESAYLDSLAWGEFKLGHFDEARKQIDLAIAFGEENGEILEHAGDIYCALGQKAQAGDLFKRALAASPEEPARIRRKLAECAAH